MPVHDWSRVDALHWDEHTHQALGSGSFGYVAFAPPRQ